ncbi:maleate cis-trans isomerase family protein [Halomonas sp. AOP42-C1-46]|uniref:maleate cis-trans isomerase family protein n=1 Tax=Halomonas sp. AOP42-C1-46 TaxID=3457671 RepID=UPI004034E4C4
MDKARTYRIGQIVPSSNVTMETEIPAMLRAREGILPERFTFHSSRMRMKKVSKEELEAMDRQSDRCAAELADAQVDVMGYACLVAIMSMGHGYHRESEQRLTACVRENDCDASIVTSAGALIEGIQALGVSRVAVITPYMKPLTKMVVDYIEAEGIEVVDSIALEISDNLDVAAHDPENLKTIFRDLDTSNAEAIVLSACVQMPSLPAIPFVEEASGLPVLSAAVSTTYCMLKELGLKTRVPGAGALLSGNY